MKLFIFSVAFATYLVTLDALRYGQMALPEPYGSPLAGNVQEGYINQTLDHTTNNGTWQQRYFVNTNYWQKDVSPAVFLKLFGEEPATPGWLSGGDMYTWGIRYGALMFSLEHRFYGMSRPTPDGSDENIKYLTSEQALADAAEFITQMNTKYSLNTTTTKWIVFGCSYAGSLTAWARLKYPDKIYGAVASSSPLRAKADFWEFDEILRQSLESSSPGCATALTNATKTIQSMLDTNAGIKSLQKKFSFCGGFNPGRPNDRSEFFSGLTAYTALAVQYNGQNAPPADIATVCKYMNNQSIPEPIDRLSKLRALQGNGNCITGSFKSAVNYNKGSSWDDDGMKDSARQWSYQQCNEFGFFRTSSDSSSLFGDTIPLSYFTDQCTSIFGSSFNPNQLNAAVAKTNKNYQALNINVSRLIVVEGSIDPWYPLGILKNPTADTQQVFIQGGSHCQDVLTPQSTDSQNMKNARKIIQANLDNWIVNQ